MNAPASAAVTAVPARIDRFEIVRRLGSGAQGAVYLAEDSRLGRRVAVKTLRLAGTQRSAEEVRALLDEARIVSRIQHPNVVTLYDAGEDGGTPFLVLEYVEGETLAAAITTAGRLAPARAAAVARQILAGVAAAHVQGVVHRDLKPSNVMLAADGTARVMDFGIAARLDSAGAGLAGTPSYMAPECIDARRHSPAADVFGVGMILYAMLTGAAAVTGPTTHTILYRLAQGDFPPPSRANTEVDARLDAIVMRALAVDPAARYAAAEAMDAALADWMRPTAAESAAAEGKHGTVEFLLRRMRHSSDFPALSATVGAVNRAVASERSRASVLCNAILKDVALTNKLLKLVNSAYCSQFGGSIGTVSRAVAIIGFDGVRSIALSLVLFEHLQNKPQGRELADELAASYLAALVARQLGARAGVRDGEEAYICGMLGRLGRLLVTFYLPDEAQAIARLSAGGTHDDARAAREILGVGYEDIGMGVARSWHFPDRIVNSMQPLADPPRHAVGGDAALRVVANAASGIADALHSADPKVARAGLARVADGYGRALGLDGEALDAVMREAVQRLAADAPTLGLPAARSALLDRARAAAPAAATAQTPAVAEEPAATVVNATRPDAQPPAALAGAAQASQRGASTLASGVHDITSTLAGDYHLNDVLRMILETMFRGIAFARVLLFVRDAAANALRCRSGFGPDVEALVAARFAIPLEGPQNVFTAAATHGADLCIDDLDHDRIRPHVPPWYRERIAARGLVLFPVTVKKRPVALIYADADDAAILHFRPEELQLLRTLRNQAVLAMRQKA